MNPKPDAALDPLVATPSSLPDEQFGVAQLVKTSRSRDVTRTLLNDPMVVVGVALVVIFVLTAVFAPVLSPYSPTDCRLTDIRPGSIPGPSSQHWLGLDTNGCDELSRLIYGARQSLVVAVVSLIVGAAVGIFLGYLAGASRGKIDGLVMRIVDLMLAVPGLLFAIGVAATLGKNIRSIMIAIAVVNVPIFARLMRSSMVTQRDRDYTVAARSIGLSDGQIMRRHVLPNSLTPVIVQGTLTMSTAIVEAAGLAFLGLGGADPRVPEWGRMLTEMQGALSYAPRLAFFPGMAIALSALGFTLIGEGLREALDPKYRR